jgi:diguanylate cyclase (GGDEF)-like protein
MLNDYPAESQQGGNPHVRIRETDALLSALSAADFCFDGEPAPLALAYVSSHADFAAVSARLSDLARPTKIVAVSTAGELCSASLRERLYRPVEENSPRIVLQIFSQKLVDAVSINAIRLPNDDIRRGRVSMSWDERVSRIAGSLADIDPGFPLSARDCVALTFVDGLSACEGPLMEAVYASGRFPLLFVGGSAATHSGSSHTYIFDGTSVLENHALIIFMRTAPRIQYRVLRTHNFRRTNVSFIVVDADPERRIISAVQEKGTNRVASLAACASEVLGVGVDQLKLKEYSFGVDIGGELYIRTVLDIDRLSGSARFYCDVSPGDEIILLQAIDFAEKTNSDVADCSNQSARPITAILNDCIQRRLDNANQVDRFLSPWPMPVAGFSTFGEIYGINQNQTLTALVFFETEEETTRNVFMDEFPVLYAGFAQARLRRLTAINRILTHFAGEIDGMASGEQSSLLLPARYQGEVGFLRSAFLRLIRKMSASREQMEQLARHDALTGVANRIELNDRFQEARLRAKRYGGRIAVLFLDLDGFKLINDRFGHDAGDEVLIEVTRRISRKIRERDTLARLGGDEFVILLCDLSQDIERARASARAVAEKCIGAVKQPMTLESTEVFLNASVGIALSCGDASDEYMLHAADTAMYSAKKSGRGRYVLSGTNEAQRDEIGTRTGP